jgi:lipopolysaccharide export system permease protein
MIGSTLARYLSLRFGSAIFAVFMVIFGLIYLVDFIEMLRRVSGFAEVPPLYVAGMTFLRTPSVSERVMPFAVLGGAIFAFANLTRKLELVVARAAGVSIWQFLIPPLAVVLGFGVFSVVIFNPLSALMKNTADQMETSIFSRGQSTTDTSLWIRQRSIDGQAILRAEASSDHGVQLAAVTAYVFDPLGHFEERVEASKASLKPGYWDLSQARISAPGEETRAVTSYFLATNLNTEQITQSFVPADSVSFWDLPDVIKKSEAAGLDPTVYRMKWQTLMSRPLLLVAMVLIAASFSLRFFRFGGIAQMVSGGIMTGFVLYVVTKLVGDLGNAGLLSASLAAWSPAVIGSLLGSLALLHLEDG